MRVILLLLCTLLVQSLRFKRQTNRDFEFATLSDLDSGNEKQQKVQLELESNDSPDDDSDQPTTTTRIFSGRIQLVTATQNFRCLARFQISTNIGNVSYLGLDTCSYAPSHMFTYDLDRKILTPKDDQTSKYAAVQSVPDALASMFQGTVPVVLRSSSAAEPYASWNISLNDFTGVRIQGPTSSMCLQVNTDGGKSIITATMLNTNTVGDRCSSFKFMRTEDDYLTGPILHISDQNPDQESCVTFNVSAVPPQSALYSAPCVDGLSTQRFVYNYISKHLRTAYGVSASTTPTDQPALFFWWSGPIKKYPSIISTDNGYGWSLPMNRAGSAMMNDDRYYSGKCWQVLADKQIVANQTCDSFNFQPEVLKFSASGTPPSILSFTSVQLTIPASSGNPEKCASIARTGDLTGYNLVLQMKACDSTTHNIGQRLLFSQTAGSPCDSISCLGTLYWSGDPSRILLPVNSKWFNFDSARAVVFHPPQANGVSYQYNVPFNRIGPVTVTWQGQTACIGMSDILQMTFNLSKCVQFFVRPTVPSVQGVDNDQTGITVVERFDRRALFYLANPSAPQSDVAWLKQQAQAGTLPASNQTKFDSYFDTFVADLGNTGIRRFTYTGLGSQMLPSGELVANLDDQRGGIAFPLQQSGPLRNPGYIYIEFYFRAFPSVLSNWKQDNPYMLMSFARTSGCVLYVTFLGHLGIRCYKDGYEMGSDQVQDWPSTSPSSTSYSLLDGQLHKVAVLYTNQALNKTLVFVDGVQVLSVDVKATSDLKSISSAATFFSDPYFWQYSRLPGSLHRVSILTAPTLSILIAQAKTLLFSVPSLGTGSFKNVAGIRTQWTQCVFTRRTGYPMIYESMNCSLIPVDPNNNRITVPIDVFSLGCSRPRCQIYFAPGQNQLQNSYKFVYKPNFPTYFVSEDVGNPSLWMDMAFVTDGLKTLTVGFGVRYQQTDRVYLEVENSDSLEVANSDTYGYQCVQGCCSTIDRKTTNQDDGLKGEVFG